jgi:hypothetical protein
LRSSLALFLTILFASVGHATVVHIPADQPTIQDGITVAARGDTILVAPGTYFEALVMDRAITLTSSGGAAVTAINIFSNTPAISMNSSAVADTLVRVISGFTFTGLGAGEALLAIMSQDQTILVERCVFKDLTRRATLFFNGNNLHNTIRNNTFTGCVDIADSTSAQTGCVAAYTDGASLTRVVNNIFHDNGVALAAFKPSAIEINYNCFYLNTYDFGVNATPDVDNIFVDPDFVPTTERLNDFSPCIDVGDPDPTLNDPDGSRNDMGAFPWTCVDVSDVDGDGVFGCEDNCPTASNGGQADTDGDGLGDACEIRIKRTSMPIRWATCATSAPPTSTHFRPTPMAMAQAMCVTCARWTPWTTWTATDTALMLTIVLPSPTPDRAIQIRTM